MHSLLERLLEKHLGDSAAAQPEELRPLFAAISEDYLRFVEERACLERLLEERSKELTRKNSEMQAIFEAIPDMVFCFESGGVILDVKTGASNHLLVEPVAVIGKPLEQTVLQPVAERFCAGIERVLREKTVVSLEYSLALQETARFYEARLAPVLENQVVAIIRDITERKQSDDALFSSQQMLRTILDTIPQRVFWKDRNSVYVGCNKPLAIDCGYKDPSEIVGRTDFETDSAETAALYRADDRRVMETNVPKLNYEEPQVAPDGSPRWLVTSKVPLHDKDGNVIGLLGTYEDITERKRLEEQFRQAQKMEAFGQLAGGVAHDFNNLLTVIQGNLSFLQMSESSKADYASAVSEIFRATDRAANLTRQLLTFSRRQPIQSSDIDLNEVVANMTKMLQRVIGEHIALETRIATAGAHVHADPGMMEQALMNLVVNSRDAMPKGGRVLIETAALVIDGALAQAKPRARPGPYVRLTVRDTGTGIAAEHRPHIFEPFYTTKGVGKGTGLGLATVFGIVEQHQGWIEVESQVGLGSAFHLFLPQLTSPLQAGPRPVPGPELARGSETILLVEDETEVRALMRRLLERCGYQVHALISGVAALELWRLHRPRIDLLITDMVMPGGVGGRELAERLRADMPDLKVIYCSGYTDEMLGTASPFRNNADFMEKPFSVPEFLRRVRECLDRGK